MPEIEKFWWDYDVRPPVFYVKLLNQWEWGIFELRRCISVWDGVEGLNVTVDDGRVIVRRIR